MSDLSIKPGSSSLHIAADEPISAIVCSKSEENNAAAITIQKYFRGYLGRKATLPLNLYTRYKAECKKVMGPESKSIPRAKGGKTRVYLPQNMPDVVLKYSRRAEAKIRFKKMQIVRSILRSQNSQHLIIPKANLCGEFLVEQRLPINVDIYHNMGLYLSHPKHFNDAVRELTRLFSKVYLSDLVSYQRIPLSNSKGVYDYIRYDNLPLYLVEEGGKKVGKIGLIDLEHIKEEPDAEGLATLVRIFPLHLDIIKEEAALLKMEVNNFLLEDAATNGRIYLKVGFEDFLMWLKAKGIAEPGICFKDFEVSSQRVEELTALIAKELLKLNEGINDYAKKTGYTDKSAKDFFVGDPENIAKELAKEITPLIIEGIKTALKEHKEIELKEIKVEEITESGLVSLRSTIFKREKIFIKVIDLILSSSEKINHKKFKYLDLEVGDIGNQLTHIMMTELVKGGEIYYFDPVYSAGNGLCSIRY
jgi:hypothetical protein